MTIKRVIVSWESQRNDDEDVSGWGYGFTADEKGIGIENSPYMFSDKEDAVAWAKEADEMEVIE